MLALDLGSAARLRGWVLVQAQLDARFKQHYSCLRLSRHSAPATTTEVPLPVRLDGRITELVELPSDVSALLWQPPEGGRFQASDLRIRRVSWIERKVRMALRVLFTYLRVTDEYRREAGLTIRRALFDLGGAYQAATAFRVRCLTLTYAQWIDRVDTLSKPDTAGIRDHIARFAQRPRFHILVASDGASPGAIESTATSIRRQLYPECRCVLLDGNGEPLAESGQGAGPETGPGWLARFNARLASTGGDDWVMFLRAGDVLPPHALYWFAFEAQSRSEAGILYSDDDELDASGHRSRPRFKPDWSPEHLRSLDYIGSAAVFRGAAIAAAGGLLPDDCLHGCYDLLLRIVDSTSTRVEHLPAVLLHRGRHPSNPEREMEALRAHFTRRGISADIVPGAFGLRRIRYRLPCDRPLVTLIIPTRDAVGLLRQCVESVLNRTMYPRYEILVVNNQSREPATLAYFRDIEAHAGVRVLKYDRRFNFSAINNFAAREAQGDMLCLLNNDIEVISPDWLDEMVGHLLQPGVGAVGARLYYPTGKVQHAGVTVGPGGCASHLHIGLARQDPGYCHRSVIAHELSAVTAACLLTPKSLYQKLGGLNETDLTVAFNDVDYCLRLLEAGYRVIYTPHAELFHHESATRGLDDTLRKRLRAMKELRYMRRRWPGRLRHDPYYNPNLSYWRPDFSLTEIRRIRKPWDN